MRLGTLLGAQLLFVLNLALESRHGKHFTLATPQALPERRQQSRLSLLARRPITPHQRSYPRLDVVSQMQCAVLQARDLGYRRCDLVFRLLVAEFENTLGLTNGVRKRRVFAGARFILRRAYFAVASAFSIGGCTWVDVGVWVPWAVRGWNNGIPYYGFRWRKGSRGAFACLRRKCRRYVNEDLFCVPAEEAAQVGRKVKFNMCVFFFLGRIVVRTSFYAVRRIVS